MKAILLISVSAIASLKRLNYRRKCNVVNGLRDSILRYLDRSTSESDPCLGGAGDL